MLEATPAAHPLPVAVQPEGGIYVCANGFTPKGKDFLQDLVDDLEVRHIQPAERSFSANRSEGRGQSFQPRRV